MMNFMSLALTPTALIGLNKNLKVPKNFKCISNAKPSTFKYPEFIKIDKDKKKETDKAYREANKEKKKQTNKAYREANKEKIKLYRDAKKETISAR
jgi:26S proteasome regulatory subunit N2